MRKIVAVLLGLLVIFVFGACSTSSAMTDTPIAVPLTATKFVFPTATVALVPTIDPLTPSAIAQFFQTQEAITETPRSTYTPSYRECKSNWASGVRGNWALCSGFENPITLMHVSGKSWQFSYNLYYGIDVKSLCTRLHHLTKDETYLYFSLDPDCELIEPGFVISTSLFRMNLLNGEVVEILQASYDFETFDGDYYSISISPTGRRVAYLYPQESPLTLSILDLQTGEDRSFALDEQYGGGGAFSWSEDGTKLAFLLESEKNNEHFISMVFLDLLENNSMVTFIKDQEFRWISSRLEVTDSGVKVNPYFDTPLYYDVDTGILRPVTP